MRKAAITAAAAAAWVLSGHFGLAAVLAFCWASAMITSAGTPKTRAVEDRLNALVPRIPVPRPAPGPHTGSASTQGNSSYSTSNSSYSTSNSSYSVAGQNSISSPGTSWSQGWGQQVQSTVGALFGAFNALQSSYSNTIPAFNALQGSYSNTVPALNALQSSYSNTVPQVNSLASDHNALVSSHNTLLSTVRSTGVLT